MYSKKLMKRFTNPKFSGVMKNPDAIGEEGNVRCGDIMKIYIKVKNNKITDIKFQTYGCMAAIASTDVICELAKGKTLENALKIKPKDVVEKLEKMPPIKFHCSVLGTKALKRAIDNYKKVKK